VNFYGYVRATQDIDFLILPSKANAEQMTLTLAEFGFADAGIPQKFFEQPGAAIHLGVEPNRIDLLTRLVGLNHETIFANSHRVSLDSVAVNIIALEDLLKVKRASARLRDQADAEELARIHQPL